MSNHPETDGNGNDGKIIRQVLAGNVDAFEVILKKYSNYVAKIAYRHVPYGEVEEITHEVFVRAYQSLAGFQNKGSLRHWLSAIAVRTCYDFWREHYRKQEIPLSDLSDNHREWLENALAYNSSHFFSENNSRKEAREVLDWALGKLSPENRMVMELVYLEGRTVKETAELLGWSTANVKIRSFRARRKLHKILLQKIKDGDAE